MDNSVLDIFHPVIKEWFEGNSWTPSPPQEPIDAAANFLGGVNSPISMCCCKKWHEDDLFNTVKKTYSFRNLMKSDFIKVLKMLSGDYEHMEDIPAKPRIVWDRHNHTVEGNSYSRMLAVSSSGTIPDRGYFSVYLEDYKTRIHIFERY